MTLIQSVASGLLVSLATGLAWAQTPIDERHPLNPTARVEINNMIGRIRVSGTDSSEIQISGTLGEGAKGLIVEGDAASLRVRVDYPRGGRGWGGWWGGGNLGDSLLEVSLPQGVTLTVGTVSANIDVERVSGARLKVETVSGDVRVDTAAREVEVDTVSGDAELKVEGSTLVDIETVSGDATVTGRIEGRLKGQGVSGDVKARLDGTLADAQLNTVSGDLELQAALAQGGRMVLNSMSGSIDLRVPASTSSSLRIETFSGRIRSDVGTVEKEKYGPGARLASQLGQGDGSIRIESFSGNVDFRSK